MRQQPCPWCGRVVLFDDAARTTHHEAPICAGFERAAQETGGEPAGVLHLAPGVVEQIPHLRWRSKSR